jgi:hypothetical protein
MYINECTYFILSIFSENRFKLLQLFSRLETFFFSACLAFDWSNNALSDYQVNVLTHAWAVRHTFKTSSIYNTVKIRKATRMFKQFESVLINSVTYSNKPVDLKNFSFVVEIWKKERKKERHLSFCYWMFRNLNKTRFNVIICFKTAKMYISRNCLGKKDWRRRYQMLTEWFIRAKCWKNSARSMKNFGLGFSQTTAFVRVVDML